MSWRGKEPGAASDLAKGCSPGARSALASLKIVLAAREASTIINVSGFLCALFSNLKYLHFLMFNQFSELTVSFESFMAFVAIIQPSRWLKLDIVIPY